MAIGSTPHPTISNLRARLNFAASRMFCAVAFFAVLIGALTANAAPPATKADPVEAEPLSDPLDYAIFNPAPPAALDPIALFGQAVTTFLPVTDAKGATSRAIVPAKAASAGTAAASDPSKSVAPASSTASGTAIGLQYIPVTPCRVADTRNATGPFGGPSLIAASTREFDIPSSGCGIPSTAVAYSLNTTVVPAGELDYLTLWPTGEAQPTVSTLNSLDGRIKANAAITPAGTNGGVDVYVSNATNVILDIDGYFVPAGTANALAFYPLIPCRVADTRNATGPLGGPFLAASTSRIFNVQSSSCGIPATAQAYSLNVTALPHTTLTYLTTWPTGETQPGVSTLNALTGAITANAAIVPAGNASAAGAVSIYVSDDADVVLDVNGYFAPPATGGLLLYTTTPCRALDTRSALGPFNGVLAVDMGSGPCAPPSTAQAYVLNATVVPAGPLTYLTLWPDGETQPTVSTLNALDGAITSNMAIVPTTDASVVAFSSNLTHLILDISSYFAPPAGPPAGDYFLTVNSSSPASGVAITASPADVNGLTGGNSSFTLTYKSGTSVSLNAPSAVGGNNLTGWTGCNSVLIPTCFVQMKANTTVSVAYAVPTSVTGVTISPTSANIAPGATQQFIATVTGTGPYPNGVTWSINGVAGGNTTLGTISTSGLYITPFPVPSGALTVTAASNYNSTIKASAPVTITIPNATGPSLAIDVAAANHTISPNIYGMNAYAPNIDFQNLASEVRLSIDRWGGDATTRYNYLLDVLNSASDNYYEVYNSSNSPLPDNDQFNQQVARDRLTNTTTLGTMPLIGWTTKAPTNTIPNCSFSIAKYGAEQAVDPYHPDCGNGNLPNGNRFTGNDPTDTSFTINESWTTAWMQYIVGKFGTAANGGVAIYDLDNEPEYWGFVHHDVHPTMLSYDELSSKGLSYAKAIKAVDPTALVSGPVISAWNGYFYSPADWISGWSTGPYYVYNGNPVDRMAHNNIPFIEYYLQQFKANNDSTGVRLLDYLDLHTYFAAQGAGFAEAGTTDLQAARVNSTRVFWDPSYIDPNYTDPNNRTNQAPAVPPMLIPLMKSWVANDYPGTKLAITEYNWGAQDHINGAIAQADILGIFGREGLDLGTLWGAPDPKTDQPAVNAFEAFRNYDGNGSGFGETSVSATSSNQYMLSVYAATRAADSTLTVVVVNKSFSNLTSKLTLANVVPTGVAKVFLYSNANLASIVAQAPITITGNAITTMFPAQSITIFAIPK